MNDNKVENLLPQHLSDLRNSGLSDEQIKACGYFSVSDPESIAKILNWKGGTKKLGPCLAIPYFNADGTKSDYIRLKPDKPRIQNRNGKSKGVKYEAPRGESNRAYFPPGTIDAINDPTIPIIVTEGEKKAAKVDQEGLACIGLAGVWAWQKKREQNSEGKKRGPRELISDLAAIAWKDRLVHPIFDSDAATNKQVSEAIRVFGTILKVHGAIVVTADLPGGPNGEKVGLDDYLLTYSSENLQTLIDRAGRLNELNLEARIKFIVEEDGPEGLFRDKKTLELLAALSVDDRGEFAAMKAVLKKLKVGLRDFDRVVKPLIEHELRERPAEFTRGATGGFFTDSGCICRQTLNPDGPATISICNFTAEIVEETVYDDGVERRAVIGIKGMLQNGKPLPRIEVSASKYMQLDWVVGQWGTDAVVWPGESRALPAAIQALSDPKTKKRQTVYTHLGWRSIDGRWVYLHGGGAIGLPQRTERTVSVDLTGPLANFQFPPSEGIDPIEAIRASLQILDLADDSITFVMLSAIYRAVIRKCDFALFFVGPSGVFKTEFTALGQQHFGAGLDARHLPGSWSSTANANEGLAFLAKDAILVIDDFKPIGDKDSQRLNRDADRLFRGQGNSSGRGRMNADGTLRPSKPPRGLIVATGEDLPGGQSLLARLLAIEVADGDIDILKLTQCQDDAARGLLAIALSQFIEYIASDYDKIQKAAVEKVKEYRSEFIEGSGHARTPGILADLYFGFRLFISFCLKKNVVDASLADELRARCKAALICAANRQVEHQQTYEPASHFSRLLRAVIFSGRAFLAGPDGQAPPDAGSWGWKPSTTGNLWQVSGRKIGWVDDSRVYLLPDPAFSEVQSLATSQGESIPTSPQTMWKRMHEAGMLVCRDEQRQRNTIRKTLDGKPQTVLCLLTSAIFEESTVQSVQLASTVGDSPRLSESRDGQRGRSGRSGEPDTVSETESNQREEFEI